MRGRKHDFLKNGSEIFFAEGLDRGDRIELARKIVGFAHEFPEKFIGRRFVHRVLWERRSPGPGHRHLARPERGDAQPFINLISLANFRLCREVRYH